MSVLSEDAPSDGSLAGFTKRLEKLFHPVYQTVFNPDGEFVNDMETKLAAARVAKPVEMYLSRALGIGAVVGLVFWGGGMLLGFGLAQLLEPGSIGIPLPDALSTVYQLIRVPLIVFVAGLFFGSIGFSIGFGAVVMQPYVTASGHKREINTLLPDAISFMYALSVGGMNQIEVVRAVARADDTYGEVAKEFDAIMREADYFDTDYRTAVRNRALETPSEPFGQFLTDMLSILDSGGDMTSFLEDEKDKHMRTAKQEQEKQLETLELFGEMYMTVSLFPLLLIILLVIINMMGGGAPEIMLYLTVYGLIPIIGVAFLILVTTVTQDEMGDGYLHPNGADSDDSADTSGVLSAPKALETSLDEDTLFTQMQTQERRYNFSQILKSPHIFFRDNPVYVLGVTVPITMLFLAGAAVVGELPLELADVKQDVIWGTFVWIYMPVYVNLLPLAVFHSWNVRRRRGVLGKLSENLRKLASANDTGMTLLESMKVVSETSSGRLATEFERIYAKVQYDTTVKQALREFNNTYHIPRLARVVRVISESQETSSHIQQVLSTAATASENQDEITQERVTRSRMQIVIILMTYFVLLAVMALLQIQFLDTMTSLADETSGGDGASNEFIGNLEIEFLSMLFFHAVTLQALTAALIAGYIRSVSIIASAKYAVFLSTSALIVWYVVEQITGDSSDSAESAADTAMILVSFLG